MVAWCYAHDVVVIPRGGGTGFAGGCVPLDGGVVLTLERLGSARSFDPLVWRMERWQMGRARKQLKQADPQGVATHGHRFAAHGKEGIDDAKRQRRSGSKGAGNVRNRPNVAKRTEVLSARKPA